MKTLRDLDLKNKRVLVRVDFNVPQDKATGEVADDTRLRAALPTIVYLMEQGAKVILASHLGRPNGQLVEKLRLDPVARSLSKLLGKEVKKVHDCVGPEVDEAVRKIQPGDVLLLENLRFHPEEEKNDPAFAKALASLADVYINDAFGAAHRAHASTEGIAAHMQDRAAGLLMAAEVAYLGRALTNPDRPFVAILGGAKVSDKLEVIENLLDKVDALLIGGAMAYTFFKARGLAVGTSLVEDDLVDTARDLLARATSRGVRLELPVDHVVASALSADVPTEVLAVGDASIGDRKGLDIGPKTLAAFRAVIATAKTVVWNGPMGVFELEPFAAGTIGVAHAVADVKGTTIIGGGDSVAAVARAGVADRMTHISTGGGASLEFLGGQALPGVVALS